MASKKNTRLSASALFMLVVKAALVVMVLYALLQAGMGVIMTEARNGFFGVVTAMFIIALILYVAYILIKIALTPPKPKRASTKQ